MDQATLVKFFFNGLQIFLLLPISIARDGTVKMSRNFKWLSIFTILGFNIITMYYHSLNMPQEVRTDPYVFLGFLRGGFFSTSSMLGPLTLVMKADLMAQIIQKLNKLQSQYQIGKNKLHLMFCLIVLQLITVYLYIAEMYYLMYNYKEESLFYRIVAPLGASLTTVRMYSSEILYINVVGIITEYFDMINKDLKKLDNTISNHYNNIW